MGADTSKSGHSRQRELIDKRQPTLHEMKSVESPDTYHIGGDRE